MGKKSEYKSSKSVAKNPTVPISVDDPRLAWNKLQQTKSRQGAEIDMIGADGKSLIQGGSQLATPNGGTRSDSSKNPERVVVPPTNGNPAYTIEGYGALVPTDIMDVHALWSGEDLIISFNWDNEDPANATVAEFILEITADGITRQTPYGSFPVDRTQSGQTVTLTKSLNRSTIGIFRTSITSVCVYALDSFYNRSSSVCAASVPAYVLNLPVPVINVTAAANGYNVAYTIPTESVFDAIDIVEYESDSSTEPTGVTYSRVYFDSISPAKIITINTNQRWVKARFSSDSGVYTAFSAGQKVTPLSPISVDTSGPGNVVSVTATAGIDTTGYLGFNGYADISWPAVIDSTLRGYRIRFSNDSGTTYTYANSPGPGTTYRLGGLSVGSTYKIAVATYDEFNNTSSSYISASDLTIPGTPAAALTVTAGQMQLGYGVGGNVANRGLYFDSSNYWYIKSDDSANLKVGGDLSNYILWDGAKFTIDGDVVARGGSFSGNILMSTTNASIYNGTINSSGNLSGDGFALNSSGLKVAKGSNSVTIDAANGLILANAGNIGGWTINANEIKKVKGTTLDPEGTISLNSAQGYISVSNDDISSQTAGINSPTLATDNVFWSGGTGPTDSSSSFRVDLSGKLYATNAEITGKVNAGSGGFGTFDPSTGNLTTGWAINENGITATGAGRIKVGYYSIKSNDSSDFGIYDDSQGASGNRILGTDTVANIETAEEAKRIFIGDLSRHVEVEKSAPHNAEGSISVLPTTSAADLKAYRSGGLRNMFTTLLPNFNDAKLPDGTILLYPSARRGDVLIVYETDGNDSNPWKKINSMYLNTRGVSGILYYHAQYTLYQGTCYQAPGVQGSFSTYNPLYLSQHPIISGTSRSEVFIEYAGGGYTTYTIYSTVSDADAINGLNAHAYEAGNACAPGYTTTTTTTTTTAAPTLFGITGTPTVTTDSISFSWANAPSGTAFYGVYYRPIGGSYSAVSIVSGTSTTITGLSENTNYEIVVEARNSSNSALAYDSRTVATSASGTTTTAAPGFSITSTSKTTNSVTINWSNAPAGTAFYGVYRSGMTTQIVSGNSYTFTGLSANTTYILNVEARNSSNSALAYASVDVTTDATGVTTTTTTTTSAPVTTTTTAAPVTTTTTAAPVTTTTTAAPVSFGITGTSVTSSSATITWSNGPAGTAFYGVYRSGMTTQIVSGNSFTFTGLSSSTNYTLNVEARNSSNSAIGYASVNITTDAAVTSPPATTTTTAAPTAAPTTTTAAPTTTTAAPYQCPPVFSARRCLPVESAAGCCIYPEFGCGGSGSLSTSC